ncbi:hypothetical protein [Jiella sp. M17.18]|uniref:hypothetical protein n=1 Tax=Jiella sp. M17.18 TaxID=3234247 RepID=UPI0034DEF786
MSGAIAFYFRSRPDLISAEDVPTVDGEIDAAALKRRIEQMRPDMAVIERVGAMPKQGVSSTFKFGQAYGTVRGVVAALGIPTHLVTPSVWKKHFALNSEKEKARNMAILHWPDSPHFERKKDHGRAEAALLARYGADVILEGRR